MNLSPKVDVTIAGKNSVRIRPLNDRRLHVYGKSDRSVYGVSSHSFIGNIHNVPTVECATAIFLVIILPTSDSCTTHTYKGKKVAIILHLNVFSMSFLSCVQVQSLLRASFVWKFSSTFFFFSFFFFIPSEGTYKRELQIVVRFYRVVIKFLCFNEFGR